MRTARRTLMRYGSVEGGRLEELYAVLVVAKAEAGKF